LHLFATLFFFLYGGNSAFLADIKSVALPISNGRPEAAVPVSSS
jgi:hypothetical protein